jgi:glutamyl-tRNA reductase
MSLSLVNGGVTFHHAPVEVRERLAFRPERLPGALCRLRLALDLEEAVLLSTCNRVEFFGITRHRERALEKWPDFLQAEHQLEFHPGPYCRSQRERGCVEHLFRMASGLESMVVGETEILGQVKDAYEKALKQGLTRKGLNRLFQSSFSAAKAVRSATQITRGSVSVGSVAADLAMKLFGRLEGLSVLMLGAGEMSERTARALQSRGVRSLTVANRTFARAHELATALHGEALAWEDFETRIADVDIIIASTSAPHYLLTQERLQQLLRERTGRPLFLIDLAVPRNLEPSINSLEEVYLYDMDDLESISRRHQQERTAEISRCETILAPHVDKFMHWLRVQELSLAPASSPAHLKHA